MITILPIILLLIIGSLLVMAWRKTSKKSVKVAVGVFLAFVGVGLYYSVLLTYYVVDAGSRHSRIGW